MTTVFDDGLICLDGTDYAAIPLALQSNAAVADAALKAINDSISGYNNRPWAQGVTTGNNTIAANVDGFIRGESPPGLWLQQAANTFTSSGLSGSMNNLVLPPRGWYLAGFTATFQATGAVNVSTTRTLGLTWNYQVNGINQYDQQAAHMVIESNTGGDAGTVAGMFFADGTRNYTLIASFNHRNTSSSMQVNAGARFWVTYLGSGLVV